MNRRDFQKIADVRILEARSLIGLKLYDGAYYLSGYAVECALKACVAKRISRHEYPPSKDFSNRCFTHSIEALVELAGLTAVRKADADADPALETNWNVTKRWNEQSRYQRWSRAQAEELYTAIADPIHGVLQWLKVRW
jgi:HEPN domain-containing protein